ncbi:substrate-binding domain-containing protein [Anaeromicropila herbilytica]|uniref:Periplasmic binding protein domain-containing protein n=1 Tax=Anaeromicropila herbilytica TaxID=2785025 RepID=A0A7R7ELM3_9FIRM|nr:substrate-binding domain-containing protein [Anaeromicropila herbilytica]BCN31166.1 hypothetical protein bsdtb5_24610 [Anaeromicropila herbilytica]
MDPKEQLGKLNSLYIRTNIPKIFSEETPPTNTNKKYTIGCSVYNSEYEYFKSMQDGVIARATELDMNVITHNQNSNTIEMINGCIELINQNVAGLIISPYNPEAVPIIVSDAQKKKIPVIIIDQGTGGADVEAFIISDSFAGGIIAAEYSLKLIKQHSIKSNNVAIIKVEKTSTYALRRGQAYKSVMLDSGYHVVAEVTANSLELEAYNVMKVILGTYKDDLAAVFCENDRMALGAAKAIEEAGKKGQIILIGFDGISAAIEAIKEGLMQGTIAQQPIKMGRIGAEIMHTILEGELITYDDWTRKVIYIEVYLIDENGQPRFNAI